MFLIRFILIFIVLLLCTSETLTAAPEITPEYRKPLSNIWLRSFVRLPVFYDDASSMRLVSRSTPLTEVTYAPTDLVSISGSFINQAGRNSVLRKDGRNALWDLAKAFQEEFHISLTVVSGYRSANYQQRLWDLGRCTDSLCAPPGYSEHQLGLAVDLFDASTDKEFTTNPTYRKYIKWLRNNAHLYGWTESYQKWVEIDEYEAEPWHYRYIGITLATRLHNLGWTYTEFVRFQEAIQRR